MPQCRDALAPGRQRLLALFGRRKDRDYRVIASFSSTNSSSIVTHLPKETAGRFAARRVRRPSGLGQAAPPGGSRALGMIRCGSMDTRTMGTDLQTPFDASVVMVTVVRDTFAQALRSVFAQAFAGRIQVLVGVDRWIGDPARRGRLRFATSSMPGPARRSAPTRGSRSGPDGASTRRRKAGSSTRTAFSSTSSRATTSSPSGR